MTEVVIYASPWCGYCYRAKKLLQHKGVAFREIDVESEAGKRDEMETRSGGRHTVPQIFIDSRHVGGSDELHELDRHGELDKLLGLK
jgi:glutaredoxin 3